MFDIVRDGDSHSHQNQMVAHPIQKKLSRQTFYNKKYIHIEILWGVLIMY